MPLLTMLFGAVPAGAAPGVEANIAYGNDPAQVLDLRTPATPPPYRLVVFVHGGGWTTGSKGLGGRISPPLLNAGYAVASVEYRKVPQTTPAGATSDVAHAIAYLLNNGKHFGIDPSRFAVLGHSAGATLVALLATDPAYLRGAGVDPAHLVAAMTLDGVFDIGTDLAHHPNEERSGMFGDAPASWQHYSPASLLAATPSHAEFCVLHEDTNRRFREQAAIFEAALKQAGAQYVTTTAHGLTHGQLVQQFDDPGAPMAPFVLDCLNKALPARG
jgi:arylformamidase